MDSDNEVPWWQKDGFASVPKECYATGEEKICRAHSFESYLVPPGKVHPIPISDKLASLLLKDPNSEVLGSRPIEFPLPGRGASRFFFAAKPIEKYRISRVKWTFEYLERNLNAFAFGNLYHHISVYKLNKGTKYLIGPINLGFVSEGPGGYPIFSRKYQIENGGELFQIKIVAKTEFDLIRSVTLQTEECFDIIHLTPRSAVGFA